MEALFAALEGSAPAAALRTSFVAYPLVNAAHILATGGLVAIVLLLDLRVLGAFSSLPREPFVRVLRGTALLAFALAVVTGIALFSVRAQDYAENPAMLAKFALLALAGLNFLAFVRLFQAGPAQERMAAKALAVLSMALWPAVLVAGRFIGFVG